MGARTGSLLAVAGYLVDKAKGSDIASQLRSTAVQKTRVFHAAVADLTVTALPYTPNTHQRCSVPWGLCMW